MRNLSNMERLYAGPKKAPPRSRRRAGGPDRRRKRRFAGHAPNRCQEATLLLDTRRIGARMRRFADAEALQDAYGVT